MKQPAQDWAVLRGDNTLTAEKQRRWEVAQTRAGFLSRTEEYRLFNIIWQDGPDAKAARETIIRDRLVPVSNFILKHPAYMYFFDREDTTQEAYAILAELINHVPRMLHPGAYLYGAACKHVCTLYQSLTLMMSLDTPLPGSPHMILCDILAAPTCITSDSRNDPRIQTLHAALRRLTLNQQCAIQAFFQLPSFRPHSNKRRSDTHRAPTHCADNRLRHKAYIELRRDQELISAIFPKGSIQ